MARSEVTGSRLSVASTNPFDEDPVPPIRASRRKKKRAPLPPAPASADVTVILTIIFKHVKMCGENLYGEIIQFKESMSSMWRIISVGE